MDKKDKLELSESDIQEKFITPAIRSAGWDEMTQIRREFPLTPGPVIVRGNMSSRKENTVTPTVLAAFQHQQSNILKKAK